MAKKLITLQLERHGFEMYHSQLLSSTSKLLVLAACRRLVLIAVILT